MPDVLLSTVAPQWPWRRQTPSGSGRWGAFNFAIDEVCSRADAWVVFESLNANCTVCCPPDRVVFVAGEPSTIGNYHIDFLRQFSHVIISRKVVNHPQVWHRQQGHPWFIERSFDELVSMQPIRKTKGACVIVSDKAFTPGHSNRLQFVQALKDRLGDRLDVWGRGIVDFESKWELLKEYRYTVVLENTLEEDYISEKLPDAWLAFCMPFYMGCPNLDRYYSSGAFERLELDNPEAGAKKLIAAMKDNKFYEHSLPEILRCRKVYLYREQFFPNLVSILQSVLVESRKSAMSITLRPNSYFLSKPVDLNCSEFIAAVGNRVGRVLKLIR